MHVIHGELYMFHMEPASVRSTQTAEPLLAIESEKLSEQPVKQGAVSPQIGIL